MQSHESLEDAPTAGDAAVDGPACLAVMYHYIHDDEPLTREGIGGLTTREFRVQLDLLCSTLEPVDWPTLYAWTRGRASIPHRCFVLTFDDGLADHAKFVAPILEERGLRGVFFVPGQVLAERRLLTAHAVHLLLATLGTERLEREILSFLEGRPDTARWAVPLDANRQRLALEVYDYETPGRARLKYLLTAVLPIEVRIQAVEVLFERYVGSTQRWADAWYLGWQDLTQLQAAGHTIGGHGFRHEAYDRLSVGERARDMQQCAAILRGGLGADLRPASYPFGAVDDGTRRACREAGFVHAFTTRRGWMEGTCDPWLMPRVDTIHVDAFLEEHQACPQA